MLLIAVNAAPVLIALAVRDRFAAPLDGGLVAPDGRRWLGPSKTWRGLATACVTGAALGPLLGLGLGLGVAVAVLSMLGDASSSFAKRRLGIPASGRALGLDQLPEALLPALVLAPALGLGLLDVLLVGSAFAVLELVLSIAGYYLGLRRQPH